MRVTISIVAVWLLTIACKTQQAPSPSETFSYRSVVVNGQSSGSLRFGNVTTTPAIRLTFTAPLDRPSAMTAIRLRPTASSQPLAVSYAFGGNDTTVTITPQNPLSALTSYIVEVQPTLLSARGTALKTTLTASLITAIDSTDKFPRITDDALLDLVQRQTFRYFWEFGHPVSGMARERNSSGDVVTTGGTGFGIMAILVAVERKFITRQEGLTRLQTIVGFLQTKAKTYHGTYPHWLNGATGETIPFSTKDNGADLVETAYLMQGLLAARQYLSSSSSPDETALRQTINGLWDKVEWSWFTKSGTENVLYWHWSPTDAWAINLPIRGWNEALITYALAASSNTFPITKAVYDNGWAQNGRLVNGNTYYSVKLPLGPALGGPLFFTHYSFLGIDPRGLKDAYAAYDEQNMAHAQINYRYCVANPKQFVGYSADSWGLTASDEQNGYSAHEPNNDNGTLSPTAALASMPYTPTESMRAMRFFYYKLGDRVWKQYGFVDAFNLTNLWFADSFLAIDQGPIIVMIENHRSGLLWKLTMSCPELKRGLRGLGFQGPGL